MRALPQHCRAASDGLERLGIPDTTTIPPHARRRQDPLRMSAQAEFARKPLPRTPVEGHGGRSLHRTARKRFIQAVHDPGHPVNDRGNVNECVGVEIVGLVGSCRVSENDRMPYTAT